MPNRESEKPVLEPKKPSIKKWIAIIIAIVVVVSVTSVYVYETGRKSTYSSPSVSVSTQAAIVGQKISFTASVKTGQITNASWNFGDGTTATGVTVVHAYSNPGRYLIFANVTLSGGHHVSNLASMPIVVVSSSTPSSHVVASEISRPVLTINKTTTPNAPILSLGSPSTFVESYLQPPTASGWAIAYYTIDFGDGSSLGITPVKYNLSAGFYEFSAVNHTFSKTGFYPVNLTVVTYNETPFSSDLVTKQDLQYLPLSYYNQVLSSQHRLSSYVVSVYVASPSQKAGVENNTGSHYTGIITIADIGGGPYSLDPAIDYDDPGPQVFANVYEQLIQFNTTNISNYIPVVATQVPTIANGGVSPNHLNYTFHIRSGLKFSNGDPVTAWDVYTTYVRTLLFMQGSPLTPGWLLGDYLLPYGGWAPGLFTNGTALYDNVTRAFTYSNATQTFTIHLLRPDPSFLVILATMWGNSILDYKWLAEHGAGISFTPSGFLSYVKQSYVTGYNTYVEYHTMGSGPYEIQSYLEGQSMVLVPNPNFTPIPGVMGYSHPATDKINLQFLKDPETAVLMMKSGQSDLTLGLPTSDYTVVKNLKDKGLVKVAAAPSSNPYFFAFNWNINVTMMHSVFGSQYTVPTHYFANPDVRKAYAYAFNYSNFLDNIVGNKVYGVQFASSYAGLLIKGNPGYVPESSLENVPYFNLSYAKQLLEESGTYNTTINIPIIIYAGDSVTFAGAEMWGSALHSIDPNIQLSPIYLPFSTMYGYIVPNHDPMPIFEASYSTIMPYYDMTEYEPYGYYPAGLGWSTTMVSTLGYTTEAKQMNQLFNMVENGDLAVNLSSQLNFWKIADQMAINLTLYVYIDLPNNMYYYSPSLTGIDTQLNSLYTIIFNQLSKT